MAKKIIFIHGLNSKPEKECLHNLWLDVLKEGVTRISPKAADKINHKATEMAYWGDISLELMGKDYEDCDSYKNCIASLKRVNPEAMLKVQALKLEMESLGHDVVVFLGSLLGIKGKVMKALKKELREYWESHIFASRVRRRLQDILVPMLRKGHDITIISHSMGAIVAYDVLWKISHMSEYEAVCMKLKRKSINITNFITIGSPLGDVDVQNHLMGHEYRLAERYPTIIQNWYNFSARGDMVCHDETIADDFKFMKRNGLVKELKDFEHIYNVYRNRNGELNPHKSFGYLIQPLLAAIMVEWLES